jgi:hypothetical protein
MDADNRNPQFEDIDHWLDRALRDRANVEPRSGLEERVLARLASRPLQRFAWWQTWAIVAAVLIVAVTLAIIYPRKQQVVNGNWPAMSSPELGSQVNKLSPHQEPSTAPLARGHRRDRACCVSSRALAKNTLGSKATLRAAQTKPEPLPKLATFPAPRPETTQERLLAQLAVQSSIVEAASVSSGAMPLKELSIPELKIDPMEGTPPDKSPQN